MHAAAAALFAALGQAARNLRTAAPPAVPPPALPILAAPELAPAFAPARAAAVAALAASHESSLEQLAGLLLPKAEALSGYEF